MRTNLPYLGKNYRIIMETNSEFPSSAQLRLAALSGINAFSYYDFSGIYDVPQLKPRVSHIEDIRLTNKVLNSDLMDLATNASGYGLFVHNWEGVKSGPTTSAEGITFAPDYPTSQGISDAVRYSPNVPGARMMGGGFGGCTVNLVKEGAINQIIDRVSRDYREAMGYDLTAYVAQLEDGTAIVS